MGDVVDYSDWPPEAFAKVQAQAGSLAVAKTTIDTLTRRVAELEGELSASLGYMLNAKIDLDTGAPKRTAMTTLEGGIRRVRTALPTPPEGADHG